MINTIENRFATDFTFQDRQTKAKYVWLKYEPILRGKKLLDVGADECHLKQYLDADASYWGIGLGDKLDQIVNLETDGLPFEDNSFDCVLCLDVLEHIENIHEIFDHLCRVAREHVIIALPNPWGSLYSVLRHGFYQPDAPLKFYGLPVEPPEDRHKWFFSAEEAERFIIYRAAKNEMRVVQLDYSSYMREALSPKFAFLRLGYQLRRFAQRTLINEQIAMKNLYAGTLWVVLAK